MNLAETNVVVRCADGTPRTGHLFGENKQWWDESPPTNLPSGREKGGQRMT